MFLFTKSQSTYLVICVVAFSQGVLGLADLAISYMMKEDYGMNPSEMTYVQGIISLPWVIKPVWGLCTDLMPIFSYRRKSYLMIFGTLAFYLYNQLAQYGITDPVVGVLLLLGIQICIAFCNVVGEALLVESSKDATPTQNVSLFFGIKAFGTLMTSYLSGYCLKFMPKQKIFQITSVFPLLIAMAAVLLIESKYKYNPRGKDKQIKDLKEFLNIPSIYRPIVFIFCFMLTPATSTAMFYFNTVHLKYNSEFLGKLKFLLALSTMGSVWFFNTYLKDVPFKKIFLYSTIAYSLVNLLTILLVTRENVALGIHDELFSLVDTVLLQVVSELNMMPILVLACRICPPKIEGTMYALLMSTINLGQLIAKQFGGIIMFFMGITETKFDGLWILILINSVCVLLPLPFLYIIREQEMVEHKERYQQSGGEKANYQDVIEREYERISLSFVEK